MLAVTDNLNGDRFHIKTSFLDVSGDCTTNNDVFYDGSAENFSYSISILK